MSNCCRKLTLKVGKRRKKYIWNQNNKVALKYIIHIIHKLLMKFKIFLYLRVLMRFEREFLKKIYNTIMTLLSCESMHVIRFHCDSIS